MKLLIVCSFLCRYNGSVVLASHDMSFLQRVVDDDKVYLLHKKTFRRLNEGMSEFRVIVDSAIEKLQYSAS